MHMRQVYSLYTTDIWMFLLSLGFKQLVGTSSGLSLYLIWNAYIYFQSFNKNATRAKSKYFIYYINRGEKHDKVYKWYMTLTWSFFLLMKLSHDLNEYVHCILSHDDHTISYVITYKMISLNELMTTNKETNWGYNMFINNQWVFRECRMRQNPLMD